MKLYGEGHPRTRDHTKQRLDAWRAQWDADDPFSGFHISLREQGECENFVGIAQLAHSDAPGIAEYALVLAPEHWGKGFGTEIALALTNRYADSLYAEEAFIDGERFTSIMATARTDNPGSYKCLERAGFVRGETSVMQGHARYIYSRRVGSTGGQDLPL